MDLIKAVLFDLDGVIFEARPLHYSAFRRALKEYGLELNPQVHSQFFEGLPTKEKLKIIQQTSPLNLIDQEEIFRLKQKYTIELISEHCRPNLQMTHLFQQLKKQNYHLAVCSNAIRHTVMTVLQKMELTSLVDLVLTNQDVTHCKPSPEIYIQAMHALGFSPAECLVIEDSDVGVQAAKQSQAHYMRVSSPEDVSINSIFTCIQKINEQVIHGP